MRRIQILLAVCAASLTVCATSQAATFSIRALSDGHVGTSLPELEAQAAHSLDVEQFFTTGRHRWMVAPRHGQCWSLHGPSIRRVCDRARRQLSAHRWLRSLALERLAALYPEQYATDVIYQVWGPAAPKAVSVARCESHFHTWAANGQYRGIFQMGSRERARFGGSSSDVVEQVEAAHSYFKISGWSPWQCA